MESLLRQARESSDGDLGLRHLQPFSLDFFTKALPHTLTINLVSLLLGASYKTLRRVKSPFWPLLRPRLLACPLGQAPVNADWPGIAWSLNRGQNHRFFTAWSFAGWLLVIFIFFTFPLRAYVFFVPPEDWEIAKPEKSGHVELLVLGKPDSKSGFCPSLNLAVDTFGDAKKYLESVKKNHEQRFKQKCRDLGPFETKCGSARLLCIDTVSQEGELRLLQLIYFRYPNAYILTAGSLKRRFLEFLPIFEKAFHSLTYTENLLNMIEDPQKQEMIRQSFSAHVKAWKKSDNPLRSIQEFEEQLSRECRALGLHWRLLLIKELSNG